MLSIIFRGVCISDMVPFYLGKFFRQSGASDDIQSKVCTLNCHFIWIHFLYVSVGNALYDIIVRGWQREGNGDYPCGTKIWKSCWFW